MKYGRFIGLLLLALSLAMTPRAVASSTWYADGVNGSDSNNCMSSETACKTIGYAISLASSGDSIMVAAATYAENLTIGFSLNVMGSGASTTIIDGGGRGSVVKVSSGTNVNLHGVTITHGLAQHGGGIYNDGTLAIVASVISVNEASQPSLCLYICAAGGGIYNLGTLTINDSTVSANTAYAFRGGYPKFVSGVAGGGIYSGGTLTINNSTIAGNSARANFMPQSVAFGGGINMVGTLTINNSTIAGNSAFGLYYSYGGGIVSDGDPLTISNSTIASNSASSLGGGIYNNGSTTEINNSTLSGNGAPHGGDIYNRAGTGSATFQNTIVADSSSGGNCYGPMISNGYNLSSDITCNFNGPGDLNNHDPLLGPLQNNGGPTSTLALLPGSPAIDAGNPAGCKDDQGNLLTTDQRGQPRPDKEDSVGCDIGAYESQSD